jgi:hypothetical protein
MNRKFGCYFSSSSSSSSECSPSSSYNGGHLLLSTITIITIALLVLLPSPSSLFSFYVNVNDFVAFASPSSSPPPPSVPESVTTIVPVPPPPPPPPPPSISSESSQSQIQENAAVGSSSDDNFQLPDGYIIEPFLSNLSMPTSIVVDSSNETLYVAESIMEYNDDNNNISSIASSSSSSPVSFLSQQLLEPQVRIVKADISDDEEEEEDNSITTDVSDNDDSHIIINNLLNWPVIDMEVDDTSGFLYAFHGYNTISRINTTSGEMQDIAIAEEESAIAGINSDGALIVTSDQENLNSNSESSSGAYNDTDDFAAATNNNNERYEDPLSLVIHSFSQIALSGKEDSREGSGSDDVEEEEDDENDGQSDNFDSQQYSTMLYVPCIDNNTDDDDNNDDDRYCVLSFPIDNSNNSDIANVDYNSSNPYSYLLILEDITSRPFGIAVLNSSYSAEAADASSSFSSSISEEIEEEEQQPSETSFISTTNEISNTSFGDNNNTTTELLIITSQQPSNSTSARSTIYLAKLFSQTPFQDGSSSSNNLENTINGNNSNYDHQQQLPPPSLQALVDYPYGQLGQVAVVFVPPVTTSSSSTDDTTERNQAPSDTDEEDEDSVSSSSPPPFGLNETTAFIVDFGDSSDSASAVAPHVPKIIMLDVETGNITPFLTPRPADPNFMPIDIAFDYNNNALYVLSIANNTDDLLDTGSRNNNNNNNNNNSGVIWKITYQGEEAEATTKSSNNGTDNNNNNATDGLSEPPPPPSPPSSSNDTDSSGNTTDSDDSDGLPEPPSPPSTDPPDNDPDDGTPPPPSEPPAANEAPVANDQTIDIEEDSPQVEIELTATDNNEDDVLTLEFTIVSGPIHGTLGEIRQEEASSSSENDDGNNNTPVAKATVTYTPDENYTGQDNFQFKVTDDSGADSNIATVTINITPINDIPIAENDTATTNQDTPVVIDVLANDSDIDGDSITIDSVDEQSIEGGSVRIISNDSGGGSDDDDDDNNNNGGSNANERIEYIPAEGFSGIDSFEYSISDGNAGGTDTATVTITVNAVNQAPVASNVQVTTDEDTPVPITLQATDEDAGDSLTFSISEAANGGQITNFDNKAGTLTYTPPAGFSGQDAFNFKAVDSRGVEGNTATVTITVNAVNQAPVASNVEVTTDEDTPVPITLQATDEDAGDSLTFSISEAANGGEISDLDSQDGTLTYTPPAGFSGQDAFNFKAVDGRGVEGNTATVTITVNSVNQSPAEGSGVAEEDDSGDTDSDDDDAD